ncbi:MULTISPECIES: replication initiation and membrane attachment family protein [Bacillaceae]|uniref:DnaD domain protein n=1 Tax=Evansella alkalicola TaxID=745819 RepID=A0ABS6JSE7_9BACI|nr:MULTISPECIES: DnaD domain protein [Bacillaceae]MBU9721162.1 DnaD domain protein [Bacillus alkalicola]
MHWKEILPSDRFIAYMQNQLHETDRDILTLLYQPLVGATAYSLYMTLFSLIGRNEGKRCEKTHKTLMVYTGQHLDEIFLERKKLEAIGLLKVFREKQDGEFIYYYELQTPLSPNDFFQDDMLSVFLYNRIGSKDQYIQLRNSFKIDRIETDNKENITRSFDQVFTSVHPSEMTSNDPDTLEVLSNDALLEGRSEKADYRMSGEDFDFDQLLALMPPFVSKKELQKSDNERIIRQMAFLYKMDALQMSSVIQDAILHTDELDLGELRKQAKRRYRMNEPDKPPSLGYRIQSEQLRTPKSAPLTDEEKQIHYFETTPPIEFMEEWGNGAKVYPGDVDIIEQLMFEYKLEPGVVNVLLEYIFILYDKKLTKNLAFKIANQWARAQLKTVKEAMDFAKKQYESFEASKQKQGESKAATSKRFENKNNVRQEPLPKWMTDEAWNKEESNPDDLEEAKKKVEKYRELLKGKKQEG